MSTAKKFVENFNGDFYNSIFDSCYISFNGQYAVFADGSAVRGNEYEVKEVPYSEAMSYIEQQ